MPSSSCLVSTSMAHRIALRSIRSWCRSWLIHSVMASASVLGRPARRCRARMRCCGGQQTGDQGLGHQAAARRRQVTSVPSPAKAESDQTCVPPR